MRSIFEAVPGVSTVIDLAPDGTFTTGTVQDCTSIAEWTKAMHNEGHHGGSEMKFAGRIPDVFVEKYCNDNGITYADFMQDRAHVRRLFSDPALSHFRVWKGQL